MSEPGSGHFDFEASRLAISPRMLVTLVALAVSIGGGIALTYYRQHTTEKAVSSLTAEVRSGFEDMRDEMRQDRGNAQTITKAFTDCLLAERANPKWKCPLAAPVQITQVETPRTVRRKAARQAPQIEEDSGFWSLFAPALAKGSK